MAKNFIAHRPKPARAGARVGPGAGARVGPGSGAKAAAKPAAPAPAGPERPKEIGGPSGPEPTRYGDWERKGICVDF